MRTPTACALLLISAAVGRAEARLASPASVAQRFYSAFAARDVGTMKSLYLPSSKFRDPVFGKLRAGQIGRMWEKTIGANDTAKLSFTVERANEARAIVRWQAQYKLFGRQVENLAISYLKISDGAIVGQRDFFSWSSWSRQALPIGRLSESRLVHRALTGLFRASLLLP